MRIVLYLTGGTIQLTATPAAEDYVEQGRWLSDDEMAEAARTQGGPQITIASFEPKVGPHMTPSDWARLTLELSNALESDDVVGAVVAHGTDTIEEAAVFLRVTAPSRKPIVVCGAMKPSGMDGSDATANLRAAIRVCTDPSSVNQGVVVLENGRIYEPLEVTKADPFGIGGFVAPDRGPIGSLRMNGQVAWYRPAPDAPTIRRFRALPQPLPRVDIIESYPGGDGELARAAKRAGAAGIVVSAMGAGYMTPKEEDELRALAATGTAVCVASRAAAGDVVMRTALRDARFIAAGSLRPWKARIVLMLALTMTSDIASLQRLIDQPTEILEARGS